MRVEHGGEYALVASKGGAPEHPLWYYNLKADPKAVMVQGGPQAFDFEVREVIGEERAVWWERAVAAYPPYAQYQTKTDRTEPRFLLPRAGPRHKPAQVPRQPSSATAAGKCCQAVNR